MIIQPKNKYIDMISNFYVFINIYIYIYIYIHTHIHIHMHISRWIPLVLVRSINFF